MNQNKKDTLLYDLADLHGIKKRYIGGHYIPRKRPDPIKPIRKRLWDSFTAFFSLKQLG